MFSQIGKSLLQSHSFPTLALGQANNGTIKGIVCFFFVPIIYRKVQLKYSRIFGINTFSRPLPYATYYQVKILPWLYDIPRLPPPNSRRQSPPPNVPAPWWFPTPTVPASHPTGHNQLPPSLKPTPAARQLPDLPPEHPSPPPQKETRLKPDPIL